MMRRFKRLLAATLCVGLLAAAVPVSSTATTVSPADEEWEELSKVLETIYGEWTDTTYPGLFSNQIPDTALLGNGDIGITSGGDENSKTFYISKSDFWQYNGSPLPIGGVTIAPPPDGTKTVVSLARGAAAYSCCHLNNFVASNVTSGAWSANSGYEGWVSNVDNSHQHYLTLDLGESKTFDTIILRHDAAARPAETANTTKGFVIAVSDKEQGPYTTVYETATNSDASSVVKLDKAVTAQYVEITVTDPNQGTTDDARNNPRARIAQVELYDSATQDISGGTDSMPYVDFYEKQNIRDAQVETMQTLGGQPLKMTTYTPAGSNLLVTELTGNGDAPVTLRATAWAKADDKSRPVTAAMKNGVPVVTRSTANNHKNNAASYTSQAALALKMVGAEATATGADAATGKAYMDFTVQPDQTVYLVTAVGGGGRTYNNKNELMAEALPVDEALALLDTVTDAVALEKLYEAHKAWWKDYWLTSYILLDAEDSDLQTIQRYYYAAQYLLGCMCSADTVAPGLYGIWHTTDTTNWNGDFHLNYNFIATFYGLYSSGRADLVEGAVQQILDFVPHAQKNAETVSELQRVCTIWTGSSNVNTGFVNDKIAKGDIDGTTGIEGGLLFPVGIGPYGMTLDSSYHCQGLNSTFSATMLITYYEYTGDEDFLKDSLYDFLKGCATFYEAWMNYDEETGKYTLYAGYNEGSWSVNPAAELAMLKCTLTHLVEYSEKLGLDADKRAKWQDMLDNMADQPTAVYNGKTVYALAEQEYNYKDDTWADMTNPVPGDGNIIPMESVEPAGVLGYYSTAEELEVAKNTIDVFSTKGAWGQQNNFPKIFPIAVNVRYDPAVVTAQLASVIRSRTVANLRISDGTHGAEKCGTTQAVNNMLVLSDEGVIKLFGGWQSNKDVSFKRLCTAGGVTVSGSFDGSKGEAKEATLTTAKDGSITVASLWEDMKVLDTEGNEVTATLGSAPNHPDEATYTFEAKAGETYTLVKGEQSSENDVLYGDVNLDSKVDSSDARVVLQCAVGKVQLDKEQQTAADVNGDGSIDSTDARYILQKSVNKVDKFPVEE